MAVRQAPLRTRLGRSGSRIAGAFILSFGMIVSAVLLSQTSAPREEAPPADLALKFDSVVIPVPRAPVPAGTKVSEIELTEASFSVQHVPEGALVDLAPYLGSVTLVALPARVPLFAENFSDAAFGSNPVIERIPPGFRAMTVPVDATSSVEGWARPGSVIDVLLVEKDKTSVVAEQVKVLSLERSVETSTEGESQSPSTVTLLVDQDQCLAINTAMPLGRIAFALRGMNDSSTWARASFSADKLQAKARASGAASVNGFVEIKGSSERYALSEGKWIKSERIPQGFLASQRERAGVETNSR